MELLHGGIAHSSITDTFVTPSDPALSGTNTSATITTSIASTATVTDTNATVETQCE